MQADCALVAPRTAASRRLSMVLLPGTYSEPEDFVREGFAAGGARDAAWTSTLAWWRPSCGTSPTALVVGAAARSRSSRRRARAGSRASGSRASRWAAYLALCYAARHADELEGCACSSPYPGTRTDAARGRAAGGLDAAGRPGCRPTDDVEREAWRWHRRGHARRACRPSATRHREDRFAARPAPLAATLAGRGRSTTARRPRLAGLARALGEFPRLTAGRSCN